MCQREVPADAFLSKTRTMTLEMATKTENGFHDATHKKDKKHAKKEKKEKSAKKDKRDKKEKRKRSSSSSVDPVDPKSEKLPRVAQDEEETAATNGHPPPDPLSIHNFRLCDTVKGMLKAKGFQTLFPIQAQTLELLLDGNDVVGRARTGSGKTLAFVLPIVERLRNDPLIQKQVYGRPPSVLVLAPTRELAKQVRMIHYVLVR